MCDNRIRISKSNITKSLLLARLFPYLLLHFVIVISCLFSYELNQQQRSNGIVNISKTQFEPIRQGKNALKIRLENLSSRTQVFVIDIQTKSPDFGRGVGWGRQYCYELAPKESKWIHVNYKIQGPITEKTRIGISYFNPKSELEWDGENPILKETFYGNDIPHLTEPTGMLKRASEEKEKEIKDFFNRLKEHIEKQNYEFAWTLFSNEYKDVEYNGKSEKFFESMNPENIASKFYWKRDQFIELVPDSVYITGEIAVLSVKRKKETWTIDIIREGTSLKVDWIGGYTPDVVRLANWENILLPNLEKIETEHFEIFCYKDSTAANEVQKIIKQRENAFQEISRFLGKKQDLFIKIVFFEDEWTKKFETGHQGMGWAYNTTIVEVYNEEAKLDPYHELVHILMKNIGNPPALFNEGFAVYMSEMLGSKSLNQLGGGEKSINERVIELKEKSQLIDLKELFHFTEIGSEKSMPEIAYPEAASFIKYLIEKHGKERFLKTYKTLKNSNKESDIRDNLKNLKEIYGLSLDELNNEWASTLGIANDKK